MDALIQPNFVNVCHEFGKVSRCRFLFIYINARLLYQKKIAPVTDRGD